ncbi:MAG: AAA family ATP:ADP antiporter, partial [Planctomycetota bacterium]
MANPLKQVLDIRREEWPLALPMCAYFFLVITTFWVLKPIKKGLFIAFYEQDGFQLLSWHMSGSQAELLAKVLNMGVALVAVTVFTLLARTLQRQQLTFAFSVFFAIAYVLYSLLLDAPSALVVWSFYLFGDLYSTLMVATFFVFLNDSVNSATAKRIYGLVGLGGVAGGAFGSTIVRSKIRDLATSEWMWVCLVLGALIVICAWLAGRQVQAPPVKEETSSEPVAAA